jgi:hypothetical protein
MPSFEHASRDHSSTYWSGTAGILAIQLAVLFVLSLAALVYLNWSSNAAVVEFVTIDKRPAMELSAPPQSPVPVRQVKSRAACARRV